jgi:hypothetical protein
MIRFVSRKRVKWEPFYFFVLFQFVMYGALMIDSTRVYSKIALRLERQWVNIDLDQAYSGMPDLIIYTQGMPHPHEQKRPAKVGEKTGNRLKDITIITVVSPGSIDEVDLVDFVPSIELRGDFQLRHQENREINL